ncbi:TEA/ATTS domain family domain-containing protein [Ditylenchus destructor]|nr:TEA/ATTS domain family domain-containing protein [Ditylenchus destructor]
MSQTKLNKSTIVSSNDLNPVVASKGVISPKGFSANGFGLLIPTTCSATLEQSADSFKTLTEQNVTPSSIWETNENSRVNPMVVHLQGSNFHAQLNHHHLTSMNENGSNTNSSSNAGGLNNSAMESVWSSDIDQAFHEALQIYPPCGRRKIILSEEGKMYGRNELIARYIKIRCGKTRTRKQVSSHIQVLARKKQRETNSKMKMQEPKFEDGNEMSDNSHLLSIGHPQINQHKLSGSLSPISSSCLNVSINNSITPISNPSIGSFHSGLEAAANNMLAAVSATPVDMGYNNAVTMANTSNNMATAALAAMAAGIGSGQGVSMWPYNASTLNNLYAASMVNEDTNNYIAQQLVAAAALLPTSVAAPMNPGIMVKSEAEEQGMLRNYTISSSKLTLRGFTAYIEQVKEPDSRVDLVRIPQVADDPLETIKLEVIQNQYPEVLQHLFQAGPSDAFFVVKCWANVSFGTSNEQMSLYAVDSFYDSNMNFDISVSTKVCSFGKQVVEKVEVYSPIPSKENGANGNTPHYNFRLEKSPMCDYMVRFITELKKLDKMEVMDNVLENFSVLQVVTDKSTGETLMVIAFMFEVSREPESSCRIYRLIS